MMGANATPDRMSARQPSEQTQMGEKESHLLAKICPRVDDQKLAQDRRGVSRGESELPPGDTDETSSSCRGCSATAPN